MQIRFNGELIHTEHHSLDAFLVSMVDTKQAFAVSVNGDFVAKHNYQHTTLHEGSQIDVLSPMQGG